MKPQTPPEVSYQVSFPWRMTLPEVRTGLKSEGSAGEHTAEVPPWEPKDSHREGAPWREAPQGTGRAQTGHEVLFVDRQRGREGTWLPRGGARAGAQISSSPEAPSPFLLEPFHHLRAQLSPGFLRPLSLTLRSLFPGSSAIWLCPPARLPWGP